MMLIVWQQEEHLACNKTRCDPKDSPLGTCFISINFRKIAQMCVGQNCKVVHRWLKSNYVRNRKLEIVTIEQLICYLYGICKDNQHKNQDDEESALEGDEDASDDDDAGVAAASDSNVMRVNET